MKNACRVNLRVARVMLGDDVTDVLQVLAKHGYNDNFVLQNGEAIRVKAVNKNGTKH